MERKKEMINRYSPEFINSSNKSMSLSFIEEAINNRDILEAIVMSCETDNSLKLYLGDNIEGEIKFHELEYSLDGSEAKSVSAISKVGKRVKFIPKSVRKEGNMYIVECSRKESQKECYDKYISTLKAGDVIKARAVKVENYGVFCDIGCGIIALLPTNNISVTHIINPKEALKDLQELYVVIKEVQPDKRIQLSHRELLGTWEEEVAQLNVDDVMEGTVLSVEQYGIFVRLSQNLSGLAEISDIDLQPGDRVKVRVNMIINKSMKVKLAIVDKIDGESERLDFEYRITKGHIDNWVYSTQEARKKIETVFR